MVPINPRAIARLTLRHIQGDQAIRFASSHICITHIIYITHIIQALLKFLIVGMAYSSLISKSCYTPAWSSALQS